MGKTKEPKNIKEEVKKTSKKDVKKSSKKETKKPKESFFVGVKKEMKNVRWPLKKEMVKYSIAAISFIVFFGVYFTLIDLLIAAIKMLVA